MFVMLPFTMLSVDSSRILTISVLMMNYSLSDIYIMHPSWFHREALLSVVFFLYSLYASWSIAGA